MKQLKLMKTLLVAVGLCMGASAWADVTPFSQNYESDGATADWTSGNTGRYTTALAEANGNHYVQVSAVGNGNSGALITGNATNGKAESGDDYTLTFDLMITGGNNQTSWFEVNDANNYNTNINGSATPANCVLLLQQTAVSGTTWKINNNDSQTVTLSKTSWNSIKLTVSDGKTYLTVECDGEVVFPRTVITTNSTTGGLGGMQFATKRYYSAMSIDNVVVREIEDGDLPTETYYTATFTDTTTDTDVTSGTTIYSDEDKTSIVANGMLVDGTTYYYTATQAAYVDYEGNFTVDGADPKISFSMTAQPTYTYTVNAVDGSDNVLAVLASGSSYNTAQVSYAYPEYINVNGTLYTKAATNQSYGTSFTLSSNAQVEKAVYSASSYTDVIYYTEAESITGMTASNSGQGDSRCSNCYGAYTGSDVELITLPAGTYKIRAGFCGGSGTTFNINAGENTVWTAGTNGSRGETTGDEFTVDGATALIIKAAGSANVLLDNIIIQKVSTTNEVVGTMDFSTGFMGAAKSMTISQGQTINLTFNNHGNGEQNYYNWLVRLTGTDVDHTFRADNFVIGDTDSEVSTRSITEDGGAINWTDFLADMQDASVEMTITYTPAGNFSIVATSTGDHTYVHNFAYNDAKSGDITVELGVEKAWLEVESVASTSVGITITDAGWASFSNAYEVAIPAGVTAYYASASSASSVTLTPIEGGYIPANTGVILNGDEGIYSATVTSTDASIGDNLLKPWLTAGEPEETTYYTLGVEDSKPVFKLSKGGTLAAGKAYLVLPTSARELSVVFDNETNGIQQVESAAQSKGAYYNLAGQRIAQPTKGLYIVNGKKVVIK